VKRSDFIDRVRGALHRSVGDPVEPAPVLREHQDAWDPDALAARFSAELEAAGGRAIAVATKAEVSPALEALADEFGLERYLLGGEELVATLNLPSRLRPADEPAEADIGITGARFGLADTGTVVLSGRSARLAGLLPMHHVIVLTREQLVPSMAEALARRGAETPSSWVQATGPSRTADIELTLSTGVHGPGVLVVMLVLEIGE
jgi:L-lactate dehydrogenase complex protein LldG